MPIKSTKSKKAKEILQHCPFCGRAPKELGGGYRRESRYSDTKYYQYRFGCMICNVFFLADRLSDAIKRWNRRRTPIYTKLQVKALHKELSLTPELDPIQDRFV